MAGAVIVAVDSAGRVVAQATSGADGVYRLDVAPGSYRIEGRPVAGIMRTPSPAEARVPGAGDKVTVNLQYDTGIR